MVPCQFKRPCDTKRRGHPSDYDTTAADLSETDTPHKHTVRIQTSRETPSGNPCLSLPVTNCPR
jgi:hypothetical protein